MKTTVLIEALDLHEATINTDARTVRQTIIKAGKSKNGRVYSEAVLKKAAFLFEGAKAYANHPSRTDLKDRPERSVLDITGFFTDVTYEGGVIKATRHFVGDAGEKVWKLVEQVVNGSAPASLVGASINAVGKGRKDKLNGEDVMIVEAIEAVNSVDDVTTPAAGGGWERLYASDPDDLTTQLLQAASYDEWVGIKPDYVDKLKKEWKQIRLEEATKAALSESDLRVKAAVAEAGTLREALDVAQVKIDALVGERDAALVEVQSKARELALEKALRQAKLPIVVENDLRARLMASALEQWSAIIQGEREKLRALGIKPHIAVSGAGQQIAPAHVTQVKVDPIVEARRQIAAAQTPAELQRIIESIRS